MSWRRGGGLAALVVAAFAGIALALVSAPVTQDRRTGLVSPRTPLSNELDVAAVDGGFFVTWSEHRAGAFDDVMGARLDVNGTWATPVLHLAAGGLSQYSPAVACTQGLCLVAWAAADGAWAQRFTEFGTPVDARPLLLAPGAWDAIDVAAGLQFVAVMTNGEVWENTVGINGVVGSAVQVTNGAPYETQPAIAAGPNGFLAVWSAVPTAGNDTLTAQHLSASGAVVPPAFSIASGGNFDPSVAGGLTTYLVAWADDPTGTYWGPLTVSQVPGSGSATTVPAQLNPDAGDSTSASGLFYDGTRWLASTVTDTGTFEVQLRLSNGVMSNKVTVDPTQSSFGVATAVASTNGVIGVFGLDDERETGLTLHAWRLSATTLSSLGPRLELPATQPRHADARLAASASGFLTAWTDDATAFDGGFGDVTFSVSGPGGVPTLTKVVAGGPALQAASGAGADGLQYWVSWSERTSRYASEALWVRPVSFDGAPGAPRAITQTVCCYGPTTFVALPDVTWALFSGYQSGSAGFGMRLLRDAGLGDPVDRKLVAAATNFSGAWAASSGVMSLVWLDSGAVKVQRFSPSGAPVDVSPTTLATGFPDDVAIASNGTDFLVVWTDLTERVLVQRVSGASGALVGGTTVLHGCCDAPNADLTSRMRPTVAWDGANYHVVYAAGTHDAGLDLWEVLLDSANSQTIPRLVASTPGDDFAPQVVAATPGRLGLLSLGLDDFADAQRAQLRIIANVPQGAFCTADAECLINLQCLAARCCPAGGCEPDAGADGGGPDAGLADAGEVDAGEADAGGSDAGADGGASADAGTGADAGEVPDGGAAHRELTVGCGCTGAPAWWLVVAALALVGRNPVRRRASVRNRRVD